MLDSNDKDLLEKAKNIKTLLGDNVFSVPHQLADCRKTRPVRNKLSNKNEKA